MSAAARVLALHNALLAALNLPSFPLTMSDEGAWRDFLSVLDSLKDTPGGALTPRDLKAVIERMRAQKNEGKAGWALRYSKILRDPETFRDLVLESRRKLRPRPAIERVTATTADGAKVIDERDPAAEADAQRIRDAAAVAMSEFRKKMRGGPQID